MFQGHIGQHNQTRNKGIPGPWHAWTGLLINFTLLFGHAAWHVACEILVPQPGMEPTPPAVEARSLNNWTAREVLTLESIYICRLYSIKD